MRRRIGAEPRSIERGLRHLLPVGASAFRRDLYHQLSSDRERKILKGTRWLLLKNPENLDGSRNEQQRLEDALRLNAALATAYYLKEDLRQIGSQPDK